MLVKFSFNIQVLQLQLGVVLYLFFHYFQRADILHNQRAHIFNGYFKRVIQGIYPDPFSRESAGSLLDLQAAS